jgi:hypothetical protein
LTKGQRDEFPEYRKLSSHSSGGLPASRAALMAPIEIRRSSRVKTRLGQSSYRLLDRRRARRRCRSRADAFKGRRAARPMMFQPSQSAILSQPRRT